MHTIEEISLIRKELTDFYSKVSKIYSTDNVIEDLMGIRKYTTDKMRNLLKELGIWRVSNLSDITSLLDMRKYKTYQQWGLEKDGKFILSNRFVIPIKAIDGLVTALVGEYPDQRKYITTPTIGFVREAQFFNMECYSDYVTNGDGVVFLVEGIFDTLALKSEGLPALGAMGLNLGPIKSEILLRFKKVVVMTDTDKPGRSVLPFGDGKKKWNIKNDVVFARIAVEGIKDPDDLIKYYDCIEDLKKLKEKTYLHKLR